MFRIHGTATVNGENIIGVSQRKIRDMGVSLIPEDRMTFGIAGAGTIEENLMSDRCSHKKNITTVLCLILRICMRTATSLLKDYTVLM